MKILLQSIQVCDKNSPQHNQVTNILLNNGIIEKIGDAGSEADHIFDFQGLKVSPGWFDMQANFCDPGYEYKEDLLSGTTAATAGGFTGVGLLPNTRPVIQTKNDIHYLKSRNHTFLTQIYPYAAITLDTKGEELTEMIDLHEAGAAAFTDGKKPVWHSDILLKTLLYLQKFNGLLINRPEDTLLNMFGVMNESINSTMLGMRGMPKLAEDLMVMRDLKVLEYTGGRIHFSNISTKEAVQLIRKAKQKGLDVTCDIAAHQIAFDDSVLSGFDTNYKVNPPLRGREDIEALKVGLQDGTIDAIVSSHNPQDEESKSLEFDLADFGIIGLQTVFPILNEQVKDIDAILEKIVYRPRQILKIKQPVIKENAEADLTVFNTEEAWYLDDYSNRSKSANSPFYKQKLKGRAVAVFNKGKFYFEGGNYSFNGIQSAIN